LATTRSQLTSAATHQSAQWLIAKQLAVLAINLVESGQIRFKRGKCGSAFHPRKTRHFPHFSKRPLDAIELRTPNVGVRFQVSAEYNEAIRF
jgi:hypothetical protein